MNFMKMFLVGFLISMQANGAVISNNIAREIPQSIVVSATAASYTLGAVTFTDAGDLVNLTAHGLTNGQAVTFGTITTTTGISINTTYYIVGATTNTFQVSATAGGAALPLTTNGTGVLSSSYYAIVRGQVKNGGSLNLNGTTILSSGTWTTINDANGLYRTPGTPTISGTNFSSSYPMGMLNSNNGSTGGQLGSSSASVTNSSAGTYPQSMIDVFGNSTAMTSDIQEFKVPAGTVIVGSGDARYSIEIYKI